MSEEATSYRRILKTSTITASSSVINIIVSVIRTKLLALLLGPSGVGLVGLYTGLMATASTVACMGVGSIGTRQIAEAMGREDVASQAIIKRAMFWGVLVLAMAGMLAVWCLREILALYVLGDIQDAKVVGWLALGVGFSVASASQGAIIQGMRRIGDMARLSIFSSALNTVLGIALLWQWGSDALWAFVLIGPLFSFLLGHLYVHRLPKTKSVDISLQELIIQWRIFLWLGIPFMGTELIQTLVQLWIRVSINDQLGLKAVGHFQAAWGISMQYIGFVLGSMAADYYPRLTGIIHDREASARLVNEQTEVALLLSGPIFIAMTGLASWVIGLLYSSHFLPAVEVLQWQILGDVLKVASWPLGFVLLAAGSGKTFFCTETTTMLLMGGLVSGLLPSVGLVATGIAFLACYIYYLPLVYFLARRRINFRWNKAVLRLLVTTLLLCVSVMQLSVYTRWGMHASIALSLSFSFFTLARLIMMSNLGGPIGRLALRAKRLKLKITRND